MINIPVSGARNFNTILSGQIIPIGLIAYQLPSLFFNKSMLEVRLKWYVKNFGNSFKSTLHSSAMKKMVANWLKSMFEIRDLRIIDIM